MKPKHWAGFPPKLFLYLLFQLSKFIPRDNNKWVFGAHFGFKDNSKFLLFDIVDHQKDIRPIWISHKSQEVAMIRSLGLECYYWLSMKGLWHCFTANVYICTQNTIEINRFASGGALYVNLNHGVGIKKCYWLRPDYIEKEYGAPLKVLERSFVFKVVTHPWLYRVPDMCLVSSEAQAKMFFSPMFRIPLSNCVYANFPRTQMLLKNKSFVKHLASKYEPESTIGIIKKTEQYNKVYIYMPTWRKNGIDLIKKSEIDLIALDAILRERNELLIMKLHPYSCFESSILNKCSNIISYPVDSDVYYFLQFSDCLITDYSSIYSEYLLMDKDIILFPFDLDDYQKYSTELEEYDKFYPGRRARNFEDILTIIRNGEDCHVPKEQRDFLMKFYWGNIFDGVNIAEEIKNRVNYNNQKS